MNDTHTAERPLTAIITAERAQQLLNSPDVGASLRALIQGIIHLKISVLAVLPDTNPKPIPEVSDHFVVLFDDGDITCEMLGVQQGGPVAFHQRSITRLLCNANAAIVNGSDPSTAAGALSAMSASLGGYSVLIETVGPHYGSWAERVIKARNGRGHVVLMGASEDLTPFVREHIASSNAPS